MMFMEDVHLFQINALGTLLATVFPAFLPRCHRYFEEGCRVMASAVHDKFMLISPDGSMRCVQDCGSNCVNRLGYLGTMALEIKCSFMPIINKMMMPINYECLHYYAAQVLTEMTVLDGFRTMVVSCSPESLTMCYLDWNNDVWQKLWHLALEFFDMHNAAIPTQLHQQMRDLCKLLKDFIHDNSVIAVEVPTLECVDTKAQENVRLPHSQFYRYREEYPHLHINVDEV